MKNSTPKMQNQIRLDVVLEQNFCEQKCWLGAEKIVKKKVYVLGVNSLCPKTLFFKTCFADFQS